MVITENLLGPLFMANPVVTVENCHRKWIAVSQNRALLQGLAVLKVLPCSLILGVLAVLKSRLTLQGCTVLQF